MVHLFGINRLKPVHKEEDSMSRDTKNINQPTSIQDFKQCLKFLKELKYHNHGSAAYEAMLIAAIISYAKPFSNNERDKDTTDDPTIDINELTALTDTEQELHYKFLTLRNKAITHSESKYDRALDWSFHPASISKNNIPKSVPFCIWNHFSDHNLEMRQEIQAFYDLASKVLKNAEDITFHKIREIRDKQR